MTNHTPETSTIDKLFLELSQFTKAKTNAQITLEYKLSEAEKTIERLCEEFNNDNGPMHMGEPVISNPFMDKLAAVTAQRDCLMEALIIARDYVYTQTLMVYSHSKTKEIEGDYDLIESAIARCEVK